MCIVSKWSCVREGTASMRPSCLWRCYRRCVFLLPTNWSVAEPVRSPQNPNAVRRANDSPPLDPTWLQWIQSAASHCAVPNSHFNIVLLSMPVFSKGSFSLMVSDQTLYGALTCPIFRTFPSWFGPGVHKSRAPCRVLKRPSALASCHLSDAVSFEGSAIFLEKTLCPWFDHFVNVSENVNFKPFIARIYVVSGQKFVPLYSKYFLKPLLFSDTSDLLHISSHRGAGWTFLSSGMIMEYEIFGKPDTSIFMVELRTNSSLHVCATIWRLISWRFASSGMSRALNEFRRTAVPPSSGESKIKAPLFSETSGTVTTQTAFKFCADQPEIWSCQHPSLCRAWGTPCKPEYKARLIIVGGSRHINESLRRFPTCRQRHVISQSI